MWTYNTEFMELSLKVKKKKRFIFNCKLCVYISLAKTQNDKQSSSCVSKSRILQEMTLQY